MKIPYDALNPEHNDITKFKINKGSVYFHIMECLRQSPSNDPVTNLCILFHDVAKPSTFKDRDGKFTYYNHEVQSEPIIRDIGKRLKLSSEDIEKMVFCGTKHMLVHKIHDLSKAKLVSLVNHPYWNILKDVAYADEKSRLHLFNEDDFNKKIEYAEKTAKEVSSGGGSDELKKKMKQVINGNKLLEYIPELKIPTNKRLIGDILKYLQDYIIDNNLFNTSEEDIKNLAIERFNRLQNSKTFKEFINN